MGAVIATEFVCEQCGHVATDVVCVSCHTANEYARLSEDERAYVDEIDVGRANFLRSIGVG